MPDVAYLSKGKLFLRTGEGAPNELSSRFVEDVQRRASSMKQRNAWKTQGRGAKFMLGLGGAADPEELLPDTIVHARVTGLSRGRAPGELMYSLSTGPVNGLFAWTLADREERRLFHSADLPVEQVCVNADGKTVACVLRGKGGISHLAVMKPEGKGLREITDGDTIDAAPAWVPGKQQLVYHSAGIGRDSAGRFVEIGPAAVYRIDLESGAVDCLAEEPGHDLIAPRIAPDGTLYFLRRPHGPIALSPLKVLLDTVLFPFRLVRAFAAYLNFFSLRYSGKPLLSAGNARKKQADLRRMFVAGNLMSAAGETEEREVDASWQLMRRVGEAPAEVVAKGVLCFDLWAEGLVYSTGGALHHLSKSGQTDTFAKGSWIDSVVVL
jgi:hypothetical protein